MRRCVEVRSITNDDSRNGGESHAFIGRNDLAEKIEAVDAGDIAATKFLVALAGKQIRLDSELSPALAAWVAERLEILGKTSDPLEAFPVKKKAGRPWKEKMHREIYGRIMEVNEKNHTLHGNREREGTFAIVAKEYSLTPGQIEKIYKKIRRNPHEI